MLENEHQISQKPSGLPTGNSILDTLFGQALATQGVVSQ
jgi:hypothetical protein